MSGHGGVYGLIRKDRKFCGSTFKPRDCFTTRTRVPGRHIRFHLRARRMRLVKW